ncbi:hypothetical protein KC343_g15989, partial [Hortaea werneckii]
GAEVILKSLLNREIDVDSLPWGPEDERVPAGIETVVLAEEVRPARGRAVEIVEVKKEGGGTRRVAVDPVEDLDETHGEDEQDDVVVIKDEPAE